GLVFPDYDEAKAQGINGAALETLMEQNRVQLNEVLPAYSKLSAIQIHEEEFAKTPKKSIKRYLYQ
ncbi:MAG: long-chain fatty acid--CoA ligase, partial [Bacteroidaceae bacterium]|nr:long-chain fatty acid--CoA ligase [Bacteroidaceae bacterium]